jgi:hypothetical protein
MLGRRAAVLIAFASLSAFGGGVAVAASHDSSPSSKPKTSTPQKSAPQSAPRSGHHCHDLGTSYSGATSPADL